MSDQDDGSTQSGGSAKGSPTGQVVQLLQHDPATADRVVRELHSYWSSLRNGRAIPARSDVDPRGIARSLDYAFILERIAPGAARIRLAGRHLIDLMGMEVRGMPICSFLNGSSRGRLSDVLETVFKAPQIAQLHLRARSDYARPQLTAQMLMLPLRSDLGDVTRVLGCLVAEGDLGVAPRRFDLISDAVMPVIDGGKTLTPSPSVIGFAETQDSFGRTPPARAGHKATPAPAPPPPTSPEERRALFRVIAPAGDQDRD
ncbi:MAG: PAS domain-containing protein [Paracoccus sp. (in: a-proteobacteria)]